MEPAIAARPLACFVHVERAGGTTLHYVLRHNHPLGFLTLTPWYYRANDPDAVFTAGELRGICRALPGLWGVGGHTTRSYLDYESACGRPVQYFTFLRDPIRRYISHYEYQRQVMGVDWSLDAFLDDPQFHDFQTARIAGRRDLDAARAQLDRFAFVGLSERFDASLVLLRDRLGPPPLDIRYARQNAIPRAAPDPRLSEPAVQARIRENNALDLELYRYAQETLWPASEADYGPGLSAAVAAETEARAGFRFPRRRRWLWGAWRAGGYRQVERVLQRWHHRGQQR